MRPVLQAGNLVIAVWRARLDQHLGHFNVEGLNLRAASFLTHSHAVYGVTHLAALCRLLPERDPHPAIVPMIEGILDRLREPRAAAALMVRFELYLLSELGFGLELDSCAVTGSRDDLSYVSPKSGRAVSQSAAEPWRDKLLPLPPFLSDVEAIDPPVRDLAEAFALTGHFLRQRVLEPRGEEFGQARGGFIDAVVGRAPRIDSAG
jgi:DNA repair protein RecO (recombination protein O)